MARIRCLTLVLVAPLVTAVPAVSAGDFSAHVGVATDYVFRGVSQSREDPVLQAGFDYEHRSGWLAGIWASQVDFPSNDLRDNPRDVEIDLYVGYGHELGPLWALSGLWVRYEYPDADPEHDYAYQEWALALSRGRVTLSVAYSDHALGLGGTSWATEITGRRAVAARLELSAGLGRYRLDLPFTNGYVYGHVAVERRWGPVGLQVGYYGSDSSGEKAFGRLAGRRVVGSLRFRLF